MKDPQKEIAHLRRILDVARFMAVQNDLDLLLATIVEATCEVLECERATIFLYDREGDQLYSRVAKGVDDIRFPADRGIAGAAARGRACVNVPDAYADERFNREVDKRTGFTTRNLLAFPLENLQGELIGVLQALNKRAGPFDADDEGLARVLSAQAGVALARGRVIEEFAEKQRIQRDLDLARSIQQALLPRDTPRFPGYEVTGWNRSADATGGDCYDFIPLADGRLAMLLADATGHGIGAALVIAEARSLVRAMLRITDDLGRIVREVNDLLCDDLKDNCFVTAFIGLLDPARHRVDYVSAGQGPLLLLHGGEVVTRGASWLPLAVMREGLFETERFDLPPRSTLVLLTDGFYECMNDLDEVLGQERIVELIQSSSTAPLADTLARVCEAVDRFSAGRPQADDLTAILIRRA